MRLIAAVLALVVGGCSETVVTVVEPSDAGADAADASSGCTCDFHWLRIAKPGDPPIACYTRGDCTPYDSCEAILDAEPSCRLR